MLSLISKNVSVKFHLVNGTKSFAGKIIATIFISVALNSFSRARHALAYITIIRYYQCSHKMYRSIVLNYSYFLVYD